MGTRPEALDAIVYADSSALVCAYFVDEPEHVALRERILEGDEAVMTSELAAIELTAAVRAAADHGRVSNRSKLLSRVMQELEPGGPIGLIALNSDRTIGRARQLCERHRLRTLDALHLAVALDDGGELAGGAGLTFLTRDADQAAAARSEGLRVE